MRKIVPIIIIVLLAANLIGIAYNQYELDALSVELEENIAVRDELIMVQSDVIDEALSQTASCIKNVDIAIEQTQACTENLDDALYTIQACKKNLEIQTLRYNQVKCYRLANLLNERYGIGDWELFANGKQVDAGCDKDVEWSYYLPGLTGCGE